MTGWLKISLTVLFFVMAALWLPRLAMAQNNQGQPAEEAEILEGTAVGFGLQRLVPDEAGSQIRYRVLKIKVTWGSLTGQEIETEPVSEQKTTYKEGDQLVVEAAQGPEGETL